MIGLVAAVALLIFLIPVTALFVKDMIARRRMKFYTDQGVVGDYVPVTGALKFVHAPPSPDKNPFKVFLDYFKKHQNNPHSMVVTNTFFTAQPTIYLTDVDSIGDFLLQEAECYQRVPGLPASF